MPLWCKSIEIQETQISWIYYRAESVALEKLYKKERWHIRNISKFTQLGKFKKLFFTQQTCSEWWQHENWVLEMKNGQTYLSGRMKAWPNHNGFDQPCGDENGN